MIEFHDWTITTSGLLGRQYDNLSRRVEVVGDLPEGWSWELLVQVGNAMDIIPMEAMDGGVGYTLTDGQLSFCGYYTIQLRGRKDEVIRHTNTVRVLVPKSLSGGRHWPTVPSEFLEVERRIQELNDHPPVPGESGVWLIWNTETRQYEESGVALPEGIVGATGYTPVKGVDYWTQEDCQSMVNDVLAALPASEGVRF